MEKKALVVLLEGDSDRLTFERGFSLLLEEKGQGTYLQVFVFRGDITINDFDGMPIESDEVIDNIKAFICKELRANRLIPSDLIGIVHLGDLDAAYCDDACVVYSSNSRRPFYDADKGLVFTKNVAATIEKNKRKREALNTLMKMGNLGFENHLSAGLILIPYRYFFFGLNLEHAFYRQTNCSLNEKERLSLAFDDEYGESLETWVGFIKSLPYKGDTYEDSCREARQKENAFIPMTNLRFVLDFIDELISGRI